MEEGESWRIYHSASNACLYIYIYPLGYHVKSLPLKAADLRRLLQTLDEHADREDRTEPLAVAKSRPPRGNLP